LVIVDKGIYVGGGGDGNTLGLFGRNKDADRAIVRREVFCSSFFDLRGSYFFDSIAVQIVQTPIADGDPIGERESELGSVGGGAFASFEDLLLGTFDFLVGDALRTNRLEQIGHVVANIFQRGRIAHLGCDKEQAGVVLAATAGVHVSCLLGF